MAPLPKPKGQKRRRNASPGFIQLDPAGREGPAPDWPLPISPTNEFARVEKRKWEEMWRLPQALEWERMHCEDDVALYVRAFVLASYDPSDTKLLAEVRQLDTKIGVSPKAMQGLRWEIPQSRDDLEQGEPKPVLRSVGSQRAYVPTG